MVDAETSTVIATLSFGLAVFGGIFIVFEFFRQKFLDIYIPNVRKGIIEKSRVDAPNTFFGSWIVQVWKYSDDDILELAGMDAYVYLRFLKMCFKITFLCSILSTTLLAVYGTAVNDDDSVHGINHLSLANVALGDDCLWTPFLFTYLFTFIFLYYTFYEYENFTKKRAFYLRTGDSFIPKQTAYSILVENIPPRYRSPPALKALFSSLFPDEVLYAYIAISLGPLDSAVAYRDQLLASLESYIAVYEASGKTRRPKLNISKFHELHKRVCCSCCCPAESLHEDSEERSTSKSPSKKSADLTDADVIVDAIDYLYDQIAILSEEISIMQMEALKAEEDLNKDTSSSIASSAHMAELSDNYVELSPLQEEIVEEKIPQQNNPLFSRKTIEDATSKLRESIQEISNIDKKLLSTLHDYKEKITKKMISATGFVTFKTRRAQAIASQLPFLSENHPLLKVVAAPPPSDIIWENMSASTDHIHSVSFLTSIMYYTGLLFWSVVLTFIAAISNLSSLETYLPFLSNLDTTSYAFLEGILPVIVMNIFLALIPIVMAMISTYIERRKTYSEVQHEVFRWYFMYQIANVYLTLLAGSAVNSISDVVDDPGSILDYISAALPSTSVFFINYCLTQLLIALPILSLQIVQLIYYLLIRMLYSEKQLTRRQIVQEILTNTWMDYGTSLPNSLYILCIALLYWVIAPFVVIITMCIFAATYVLLKYQYLYVFTRKYESGGKYWYGLYHYSMLALLASTVTMIAYMSIKEAITQAPLLLPLPFIIYFFWNYTESRFKALSENIPYSAAMKVDMAQEHQPTHFRREYESFTWDYLKQPSLVAPKYVRPYPYRIDGMKLIDERGLVNPIYYHEFDEEQEEGDEEEEAAGERVRLSSATRQISLEGRKEGGGGYYSGSNSNASLSNQNPGLLSGQGGGGSVASSVNTQPTRSGATTPPKQRGYMPPPFSWSSGSGNKKEKQ